MNCWQAKRKLLKLSPEDLESPSSPALARHIDCCPDCYAQSRMYRRLSRDLPLGAKFNPPSDFWDGWNISSEVATGPTVWRRLWNRLDWLIVPETSYRWATAVVLIFFGTVGGINLQQRINAEPTGLPNKLEFHSQFIGIAESYNEGFKLMRKASATDDDAGTVTQSNSRI